jgi:hypothetical protein
VFDGEATGLSGLVVSDTDAISIDFSYYDG